MVRTPPLDAWQPLAPDEVAQVFSKLGIPWWVAGGWAICLGVGRQTRPHADIDVAVLRADASKLRQLSSQFALYIAHDGALTAWDGAPLGAAEHQFWAHRHGADAWAFEVLLERHTNDQWQYRRRPEIGLPLRALGRTTADSIPFVAPEVAVLYKANRPYVARNAVDFTSALPLLDSPARDWLRSAIRTAFSDEHPWLPRLSSPTRR